jgi:predicted nucleic acid-binding protein
VYVLDANAVVDYLRGKLVTRNVREFARVPELKVVNWYE